MNSNHKFASHSYRRSESVKGQLFNVTKPFQYQIRLFIVLSCTVSRAKLVFNFLIVGSIAAWGAWEIPKWYEHFTPNPAGVKLHEIWRWDLLDIETTPMLTGGELLTCVGLNTASGTQVMDRTHVTRTAARVLLNTYVSLNRDNAVPMWSGQLSSQYLR